MSSKSLEIFEKTSDFLLKPPFLCLQKASTPLKMSLKSLKILQSASHYWKEPPFLFKSYKKASDF
jgi:hypothetical protein